MENCGCDDHTFICVKHLEDRGIDYSDWPTSRELLLSLLKGRPDREEAFRTLYGVPNMEDENYEGQ